MLEADPHQRISAKDSLLHNFFRPELKLRLESDFNSFMSESSLASSQFKLIHLY